MSSLTHKIRRTRRAERAPHQPTYEQRWEQLWTHRLNALASWPSLDFELPDPHVTMGPLLKVPEFEAPEEPLFLRLERFNYAMSGFVAVIDDATGQVSVGIDPARTSPFWA